MVELVECWPAVLADRAVAGDFDVDVEDVERDAAAGTDVRVGVRGPELVDVVDVCRGVAESSGVGVGLLALGAEREYGDSCAGVLHRGVVE